LKIAALKIFVQLRHNQLYTFAFRCKTKN